MRLLSFDTSSRGLSVAILEGGKVVAAFNHEDEAATGSPSGGESAGKSRADRQEAVSLLVPTIDRLVRECGLAKNAFDAIVTGIGPGGFTGVRVAVVTARTLAQALRLPVVGINSLEVAAMATAENSGNHNPGQSSFFVVKEASKTHVFFAAYAATGGSLHETIKPAYLSDELFNAYLTASPGAEDFTDRLDEVCLEAPVYVEAKLLGRFAASGGSAGRLREVALVNNAAVTQAKIAELRLSLKVQNGEDLSALYPYRQLQPLYLRGASVTLKKGDVIERVETH